MSSTKNRKNTINTIFNRFLRQELPVEVTTKELETDHRAFRYMLLRRNLSDEIGVSKDKTNSSLWFYRRNNGQR